MKNEMMKKFEELKEANGYFELDGKNYALVNESRFDSKTLGDEDFPYYESEAICAEDEADEEGFLPCYRVRWDVLESYDPEQQDESYACNWNAPEEVKQICEYELASGRIL